MVMTDRLSILTYKGKRILFINMANLKEPQIIDTLDNAKDYFLKEKIRLAILDISNTITTSNIKEKSANLIYETELKIGKIYTAMVGLRLSQQILAKKIKDDQFFASTLDEAKEWLIQKQ